MSPEQIAGRLKLEEYPIQISYSAVGTAIGRRTPLSPIGLGDARRQKKPSDRGREFQLHGNVTIELGVEFYFPPPHQPWQRGTNENTNDLLREYFPKGYDFNTLSDGELQAVVNQLNKRPRKCLGYKTPWEIYFSNPLHLI